MDDEVRQRQLQALWKHVTDTIKQQIVNPTLWRAMEAAKPITIDGNQLILGLEGTNYHLASNLDQIGPRSAIEKLLSTAAHGELHFRIIQGETFAEWQDVKLREQVARELAERPQERQAADRRQIQIEAASSWDDTVTAVHRAFMTLAIKSIPQARAQYILDVLPIVLASEQKIAAARHDELGERGLGRVIEKIAQLSDVDPTTVALEYLHYRAAHQSAEPANEPAEAAPEVVLPDPDLPEKGNE